VTIGVDEWADDAADLLAFDRRVHAAEDAGRGPVMIKVRAGGLSPAETALATRQIHTRYQRHRPIRNFASLTATFERVLSRHRALHDVKRPLVRAEYDHACDTWQWAIRMEPSASLAVQVAALFHDIEWLQAEATSGAEPDAHALRGAELTREVLVDVGLDGPVLDSAAGLVAKHERPFANPDLLLLNDADALSFFALNSWAFLTENGVEPTRKKVAFTLARMRPSARKRLAELRHHPVIAGWLSAGL
jgi:hypothetical protein